MLSKAVRHHSILASKGPNSHYKNNCESQVRHQPVVSKNSSVRLRRALSVQDRCASNPVQHWHFDATWHWKPLIAGGHWAIHVWAREQEDADWTTWQEAIQALGVPLAAQFADAQGCLEEEQEPLWQHAEIYDGPSTTNFYSHAHGGKLPWARIHAKV